MNRFARKYLKSAIADVRHQYRCPTKSMTGAFFTRKWTRDSKPLVAAVVRQLNIGRDDKILEIGYGRGEGLQMILERLHGGEGTAFGLELSHYLTTLVEAEFHDEIYEQQSLILDKASELLLLPYTNSFLDGIFHVNVFYFWPTRAMPDICKEFFRVLKPGKEVVCGMDIKNLKQLESWEILKPMHYDPMRYAEFLEPVGFQNVKMVYKKIDANGVECRDSSQPTREVLLITAQKPDIRSKEEDPEMAFKRLEEEVKQYLVAESVRKSQHGARQTQREELKNKEMEKKEEELERQKEEMKRNV